MSPNPRCVLPSDEVGKVDNLFREHRIHHVPVVNDENKVVGIVSKSDFLYLLRGFTAGETDRFREQALLRAFKVHEIMSKEVVTIRAEEPIRKAVEMLAENRFRGMPVVDDEDVIVGIVTTHDIVDMVARLE